MMNPESVAEKFILANCYNPKAAGAMLRRECSTEFAESGFQDRGIPVPDIKLTFRRLTFNFYCGLSEIITVSLTGKDFWYSSVLRAKRVA
jgi:hypothetical protein